MITEIRFLSIDAMRKLAQEPHPSTIVVSILDRYESPHRPSLDGFLDSLCLEFKDVSEDEGEAPWPDEPSEAEHAQFAVEVGERVPSLGDAKRILDFVNRYHYDTVEPLRLVAHCYGGISRSAAVAQWFSSVFWVPITYCETQTTEWANKRLLRLLDKAAGRH